MDPSEPGNEAKAPITAAFAVHVFTACGAGLRALGADRRGACATGRKCSCGSASRSSSTASTALSPGGCAWPTLLPRWSGDVLDLVVDILNYVFVPAYAVAASGLLPQALAIPLGVVIVVTGSLYFADRLMKTSDYYFRGFPALWNVAAFYLFLLKPAPWLAAALIAVLAALTFVPFHVVHPIRIAHLRVLTTGALIVWALLAIVAVARNLEPGFWALAGLCLLAIYFVGVGFLRRHHP